ncbi:MAG: molybdenum cofactor biosynthesis protein MoaE [Rhodospirillaceae bacterium]
MSAARVQREPFDPGAALNAFLKDTPQAGGIAVFVGQMRDFRGADRGTGEAVSAMTLEHYPGMAERELGTLVDEARSRWKLDNVMVIHRTGELAPADPIVFVATASAHRADALDACSFLIDWLKTKAPFWKKEVTASGAQWVEACSSDDARAMRWQK